MRFDLGKVLCVAQREYGLVLLLLAAACSIEPPAGRIVCVGHADCPSGFYCSDVATGVKRCSREQRDAGDAHVDAAIDAAVREPIAADAGMDAARRDAGETARADTSPPKPAPDAKSPEHDAGHAKPDPPLGMDMVPGFISLPLPECGREPDAANAYFVSAGVGEDVANCGGPQGPCRSISKALQRAVANGVTFVYLDNTAVYMETETLRLPADVVVAGGFSNVNGRWTRLCDAARGKTRLAASGNPALLAEYTGAAKLASLSLETRAADPGESMIGVLARGADTKLWLDDVWVLAADGGAGAAGAAGAPGGALSVSCEPNDGAQGESVGASGDSAVSGTFGPDGYAPGHGSQGGDGAPGHAGVLGAAPTCISCVGQCCFLTGDPCGQRGAPGCGGAAGGGGGGGSGGGSSVALFAWAARVVVSGGSLHAGSGGNAGDAGAAGSGGPGAPGMLGASGGSCSCADIPEAGCAASEVAAAPGTQAGDGGPGRDGGPGGAGAGGHAYAAYSGGAAQLMIAPATLLEFGQAGTSSTGAAGQAGPTG